MAENQHPSYGELWKRCVKVTYMGGYKPTARRSSR